MPYPDMNMMNGIASQASNSMMPGTGMPQAPMPNGPVGMPQNQGMMQNMPQAPASGIAGALPMSPMMQPMNGMNGALPGPAGARPLSTGGTANHQPKTFKGSIVSAVPGRTDLHFTHVPSGSFVIPADIVSAHGQGNTLAGMHVLEKLFRMGKHSIAKMKPIPPLKTLKAAKGGMIADEHVGKPVPVKLAGGEIVVPPESVHETMERVSKKKLTLAEAHSAMDHWVINERKKLRKTLARLPGPARD
jgi:hypothetical protein